MTAVCVRALKTIGFASIAAVDATFEGAVLSMANSIQSNRQAPAGKDRTSARPRRPVRDERRGAATPEAADQPPTPMRLAAPRDAPFCWNELEHRHLERARRPDYY